MLIINSNKTLKVHWKNFSLKATSVVNIKTMCRQRKKWAEDTPLDYATGHTCLPWALVIHGNILIRIA